MSTRPVDHRGRAFQPASDADLIQAGIPAGQPGQSAPIFSWLPGRQHLIPLALIAIGVPLALGSGLTGPPWYVNIALYLPAALLWIVYANSPLARRVQRRFAQHITTAALDTQRCPQCLYHLHDLIAEPDGCTSCPECGAAWRLPARHEEPTDADHAVIVVCPPCDEGDDDLCDIEDTLIEAIEDAGVGEFDGNEIGLHDGSVTLFCYGPDADALFEVMHPVLMEFALTRPATAILRYGPPAEGVPEKRIAVTKKS